MCSTSTISASSSKLVPRSACSRSSERTASAISCLAAVAHGHVHEYPRVVVGGLLGLLEHRLRTGGQQVHRADVVDAPAAVGGERPYGVLDDAEQRDELLLGPVQVVRGEHPERDDLDVGLGAPAEQLLDLVRARLVALLGRPAGGLGPAAVPVEDDPDVLGHLVMVEAAFHPACVEPVHQVAQVHCSLPLHAAAGPPCRGGPQAATLLRTGDRDPARDCHKSVISRDT